MLRNRWTADAKVLSDNAYGSMPVPQNAQDLSSSWIGDGPKDCFSLFASNRNHMATNTVTKRFRFNLQSKAFFGDKCPSTP